MLAILGSLSESIWLQYNWGRGVDDPLPLSCLQVLRIDLLNVIKINLKDDNDKFKKIGKIDIDQSISLMGELLSKMDEKETHVRYEIFSSLLVFTLPIDSP